MAEVWWCRVMECGIVREVLWGMKSESEGREKRFEKVSGSEIFVWRDMCDNL